jgi:hypothetical protein
MILLVIIIFVSIYYYDLPNYSPLGQADGSQPGGANTSWRADPSASALPELVGFVGNTLNVSLSRVTLQGRAQ